MQSFQLLADPIILSPQNSAFLKNKKIVAPYVPPCYGLKLRMKKVFALEKQSIGFILNGAKKIVVIGKTNI